MAKRIDLYTDSYIINYKEGDKSLERRSVEHINDIDDKFYVVREGDTLSSIAYEFYKKPNYWFIIADVNEIINPLEINIGDEILIPSLNSYNFT